MTQEVLLRREAFVGNATPIVSPGPARAFKPGLRRFDVHPRVYGIMLGAFGTFFAAYVAAFAGGAGMPLVLAICGLWFAVYFGLASIIDGVAGDGMPAESFAAFLRHGMDTETGHMSGSAVLWQIVTLPLLLAGFGLFVLAYKLFA